MNTDQTNDVNRNNAVGGTFTKYNSVISGNAVMVAAVNLLKSKLSDLHAQDQIQQTGTKSVTNTKNTDKTNMINLAFAHAQAGLAYATATSNVGMQTSLKINISELKRKDETELMDICQNIHDQVAPSIGSMASYGATSASLTALQNAITTFGGITGKPRTQKSAMATATNTIDEILKDIHALYKNTLDPLMEQYKTSNPAFYKEYHESKIIVDSGSHKQTILEGVITDGTNPILKATVKLVNTKKKKITKANGKFKFMKLKPQKYTITVTASGYVNFSENVMLTALEANKITITMLPTKSGIVVA